jgi:hypothetical protein
MVLPNSHLQIPGRREMVFLFHVKHDGMGVISGELP